MGASLDEMPTLNSDGVLDPGFYDMSLSQIGMLFGQFQRTNKRPDLFRRLIELVEEISSYDFACRLIVDGSFITAKDVPSDIDLIFVVKEGTFPLTSMINPYQYNALSSRKLRRKYGFDVFVVNEGSSAYDDYVKFFSRIKEGPGDANKGLVRLELT
jgi:hypothetical protein